MVYPHDGDRLLVYGSNNGAPKHLDWHLNLVADLEAIVEVGDERR
jgi:F420H(2)-dependent quinone reductase